MTFYDMPYAIQVLTSPIDSSACVRRLRKYSENKDSLNLTELTG